ncbi:MAG: ATP-binding protein [Myxococcota bacterium]
MQDFEKLGVFYLGRKLDPNARTPTDELLLYESRALTTHAVCVGMTGSGKTGLCLSLLEEAAIDGIPAIAIDPKGDISNLLLSFPELSPADFQPWIDPDEARRRGVSEADLAAETAERWKKGLAEHGQDGARIARMRAAADIAVYTPGSSAGTPIALFPSFEPPAGVADDPEALRERVESTVSALLALVEIEADPLQSKEHILLSQILGDAWAAGRSTGLAELIGAIQKPSFDKVGIFDLESFFPAKERTQLAMALNRWIAAPGASAYTAGAPLDVSKLLFSSSGKPQISILSIAHLSDAQRMFFVTSLLSEVLGWVRAQRGTSSLRALLYMDEIFGYFPPTANPPSKTPMLKLLKQARAFGLGVVLATQNPVDLDYKGLANCGTWFIGRLQTERDKLRVLDGLESAAGAGGGPVDRAALDRALSGLEPRTFLLKQPGEATPSLFQTRWTLSYLRGPMTKDELKRFRSAAPAAPSKPAAPAPAAARVVLPSGVSELFIESSELTYRPALLGTLKVHYVQAKTGIDHWETMRVLAPLSPEETAPSWQEAERLGARKLSGAAPAKAERSAIPAALGNEKTWAGLRTALVGHVYEHLPLELPTVAALSLVAKPEESASAFAARAQLLLRERRDEAVQAVRKKLEPKLAALENKRVQVEAKVAKEKAEAQHQTVDAALSIGTTLLGAFFGKKAVSVSNLNRARSSLKSASRTAKERKDVEQAEARQGDLEAAIAELEQEIETEVAKVSETMDPAKMVVEKLAIPAKKSEITVASVDLAWIPAQGDSAVP